MQTFLIQTIDGAIKHDFSFHLIEAIKYNNWFYNENKYDYRLVDNMIRFNDKSYIPIGSVEFVREFLYDFEGIVNVKPINIPKELMIHKFIKRNIYCSLGKDIPPIPSKSSTSESKLFVKSNDKIKGFNSNVYSFNDLKDNEEYLVSDLIDINSEWRVFIFNGRLVGLQNYSGDFTIFPNIKLIEEIIREYKDCPPAYTLDIGINSNDGTFILEVHNFFSCGLYGFADYRILPQMFISAFKYMLV